MREAYAFPYLVCLLGAAWAICVTDIKVVYYGELSGFVSEHAVFLLYYLKSDLPRIRVCCGCMPLDYLIHTLNYNEYFQIFFPYVFTYSLHTYFQVD